jgi:hypothetical protein
VKTQKKAEKKQDIHRPLSHIRSQDEHCALTYLLNHSAYQNQLLRYIGLGSVVHEKPVSSKQSCKQAVYKQEMLFPEILS